jgi:hypothetical protein
MHIGQIVLLVSLLLLSLYVILLRNALTDRLLILVILALGVLFVLWPDLTTRIANFLGIGRGADLLTYLFVVLSLFLFVYVISEVNRLQRTVTGLAREIALMSAKRGAELDPPENEAEGRMSTEMPCKTGNEPDSPQG